MILTKPTLEGISRADASKRFGRYKKEEPAELRIPESMGELEKLRRKREMLRNMSAEQAIQVIEHRNDFNFFDSLDLARKESRIIVPNCVSDRILMESGGIHRESYGWTGTVAINEKPNRPFGERVIFRWHDDPIGGTAEYSLSFNIPENFRGKKNCALLLEHPDFDVIDLGPQEYELKAAENKVQLLEHFPGKSEKLYFYEEKFRIPIGRVRKEDSEMERETGSLDAYRRLHGHTGNDATRRLWRLPYGYVGPVVRGFYLSPNWTLRNCDYHGVVVQFNPFTSLGVTFF